MNLIKRFQLARQPLFDYRWFWEMWEDRMAIFNPGDRVVCTNYAGNLDGPIVGQHGVVLKEERYEYIVVKMANEVEGMRQWYFTEEELEHE